MPVRGLLLRTPLPGAISSPVYHFNSREGSRACIMACQFSSRAVDVVPAETDPSAKCAIAASTLR